MSHHLKRSGNHHSIEPTAVGDLPTEYIIAMRTLTPRATWDQRADYFDEPAPSTARRLIAYHEAGHGVVCTVARRGSFAAEVVLYGDQGGYDRRGNHVGGYQRNGRSRRRTGWEQHEGNVMTSLAGFLAEQKLVGNRYIMTRFAGAETDLGNVFGYLRYEGELEQSLVRYAGWTRRVVQHFWPCIVAVAERLMEKQRSSRSDTARIGRRELEHIVEATRPREKIAGRACLRSADWLVKTRFGGTGEDD